MEHVSNLLPAPYASFRTECVLAALKHFSACSASEGFAFSGDKVRIGNNTPHLNFVIAALQHPLLCNDATRDLSKYPELFTDPMEIAMTDPQGSTPLPTALDIASGDVSGVILVVDIRGNEQQFDLMAMAQALPHMQLTRVATVNIVDVEVVPVQNWQDLPFDDGEELTLHQITGNDQYLVIGEWAYPVNGIREFLERNGNHLLYSNNSGYTTPAWYAEQQRVPQQGNSSEDQVFTQGPGYATYNGGLGQNDLESEDGQLLADRTNGVDTHRGTGLTELPPEANDDYYDREAIPADSSETDNGGPWLTKLQRLTLTIFGSANGVLLILGLGLNFHQSYNIYVSMLIAMIAGSTITLGTGALGAIAATKFGERPLFTQAHQAQRILQTCGALIGWMIMTLVALSFLF